MKVSVLINCYNYEKFVGEAIRSVGDQLRLPDELIVVDDGSSDRSVMEIKSALKEIGFGRLIQQSNRGQLSAFQSGLAEAQSDWIFFLDADDVFFPDHIQRVLDTAKQHPQADFLFTGTRVFGGGSGDPFHYRGSTGDLGYSTMLVKMGINRANVFVGGVTSALCIRTNVLERILSPCDAILGDWKVRADEVLVLGSSWVGARKVHIPDATVGYRVHGENRFAGVKRPWLEVARHRLALEKLAGTLNQICPYRNDTACALAYEYLSISSPNHFQWQQYWRIALRAPMSSMERINILWMLIKARYGNNAS